MVLLLIIVFRNFRVCRA